MRGLSMKAATIGTILNAQRSRQQSIKCPILDKKKVPIDLFQAAALFSRLAYNEPIDMWKGIPENAKGVLLEWNDRLNFEYIDANPKEDTQLYICKSAGKVVVAFRGTLNARDAMNALDVKLCGVRIDDFGKWVMTKDASEINMRIHTGFLKQYLAVRKKLFEALHEHKGDDIIVTGHSLGGALATLAALDLKSKKYNIHTVTFGAPRVGDFQFAEHFQKIVNSDKTFRIFKDKDPIPQIFISPQYFHVGKSLLLDDQSNLRHISNDLEYTLRPFLVFGTLHTNQFIIEHSLDTYIDLLLKCEKDSEDV